MTLAVTGALDRHRALFFWRVQMVRGAPTVLTCFLIAFRTDFVTSVRVLVASAGVLTLAGLWPAGDRKPLGGTPSALPLATSLGHLNFWYKGFQGGGGMTFASLGYTTASSCQRAPYATSGGPITPLQESPSCHFRRTPLASGATCWHEETGMKRSQVPE